MLPPLNTMPHGFPEIDVFSPASCVDAVTNSSSFLLHASTSDSYCGIIIKQENDHPPFPSVAVAASRRHNGPNSLGKFVNFTFLDCNFQWNWDSVSIDPAGLLLHDGHRGGLFVSHRAYTWIYSVNKPLSYCRWRTEGSISMHSCANCAIYYTMQNKFLWRVHISAWRQTTNLQQPTASDISATAVPPKLRCCRLP